VTIAVVGSNSFSGLNFCRYLLAQGHEVLGISRSPIKASGFNPIGAEEKKFTFIQADLNSDQELIVKAIRNSGVTQLVNFAAQSMVAESWEKPEHWYTTNIISTSRFYDILAREGTLEKLVHISTPEVYGSCSGVVTESQAFNPSTPYAVSRAAGDFHLRNLGRVYDFNYVLTRASNVYGPYQDLYRLIPKAIQTFDRREVLPLHGGGTSKRNFIHIEDVSRATYLLLTSQTTAREYHISGDDIRPIREIVRLVAEHMGVNFDDQVDIAGGAHG
jgi:dTDP-glucose 4,6-dehydratase